MRLLLALLVLLPVAAWADWKSDYREGIAAAERQEWAKSDALMRKALAQEPNPQARIRLYGQVFVPYVPRFYLGLSAWSRKDCKNAIELLEDVGNASAISGQRMEERQQMMLRSCRAQLAQAAPPVSPPASVPPLAQKGAAPPPATTRPAPTATPAPPKPTPAAVPKPIPATPAKPSPAAVAGAASFDTARAQAAQARLDRVDAALAAAARTLADPALAAVRGDWQRQMDLMTARAARARTSLNAARQARDAAALAAIDPPLVALQSDADKLVQGLNSAQARSALATQVRGRLQPLAAAYLSGDFARAAQWADEQALTAVPQAHAQALLLRAAARFELYVIGGERDLAQFDQIGADIRTARRLYADIKPSEKAFSPRFRSLFASTR